MGEGCEGLKALSGAVGPGRWDCTGFCDSPRPLREGESVRAGSWGLRSLWIACGYRLQAVTWSATSPVTSDGVEGDGRFSGRGDWV